MASKPNLCRSSRVEWARLSCQFGSVRVPWCVPYACRTRWKWPDEVDFANILGGDFGNLLGREVNRRRPSQNLSCFALLTTLVGPRGLNYISSLVKAGHG